MLNWREKRGSAVAHSSSSITEQSSDRHTPVDVNIRHIDAEIQLNVYARLENLYRMMYVPLGQSNRFGKWIHGCSDAIYDNSK
jgi:hypothetical protein